MVAEIPNAVLSGDLKDTSLASALSLIKLSQKNGVLQLTHKEKRATIYIHKRYILSATSPDEILFGEFLIQEGYLTHDNLAKVLELQKKLNMPIGEIIEGLGYLGPAPDSLKRLLNRYLREVIFRIVKWTQGYFEFFETTEDRIQTPAALDMDFILLDTNQRLEDWKKMADNVRSLKSALKINRYLESATLTLTASEWHILSFVNGRRTIVRILEKIGQNEMQYLAIINDLLDRKVLIEKQTEAMRLIIPGRNVSENGGTERQFPAKFTANLLYREIDGKKNLIELAEGLNFEFEILWENLQTLIKNNLIEIKMGRREFHHLAEEM